MLPGRAASCFLSICVLAWTTEATLHLSLVDRLFIANNDGEFVLDEVSVKFSAYSPVTKYIYSSSIESYRIIDASNPYKLKIVAALNLRDGPNAITNTKILDGFLICTGERFADRNMGILLIDYDREFDGVALPNIHIIDVGPDPFGIAVSSYKKTKKVVVTVQGLGNKPGSIVILDFPSGSLTGNYTLKRLTFDKFQKHLPHLKKKGFRCPGDKKHVPISECATPRAITLNGKGTVAYVVMQANNAIAKVNLMTETIVGIFPLGSFNWLTSFVDLSDRDGGINLKPHPVNGLFMPDGIAFKRENGKNFLLLANEGQFSEAGTPRGKDLIPDLAPIAKGLEPLLAKNSQLGRLFMSPIDGRGKEGRVRELFTFGARSFSVRKASNAKLLFDSDDQIERRISEEHPSIFNSEVIPDQLVSDTADLRSDNAGPEPDSIVVGKVGGTKVIVTGIEKPGFIMVHKYGKDITKPVFQSLYTGVERADVTWNDLYLKRDTGDLNLKVNQFIPAKDSPTGSALILVTGSTSNTVSLFEFVHKA